MSVITPDTTENIKLTGSLSDLTPVFLKKNYLFGLDFVDKDGKPWPSEIYDQHLNNAINEFERRTQVNVVRKKITDERHDYYINDYQLFAFIQLFEFPCVSVEKMQAVYPTGQFIFDFPTDWVRLTAEHGQIQLVPTQGTLSQVILGRGGSYLPIIYQGMGYLPQLFRVDYTAGFPDGKIPQPYLDAICKLATIQLLMIAADSIYPPGVQSISAGIDGISQGMGIAPGVFRARLDAYNQELYGDGRTMNGKLADIREYYKGVRMVVV